MAPNKKSDPASFASAKKPQAKSATGGKVVEKAVAGKKPFNSEDDLKIIEGIGKAIQSKLKDAGISTYRELSARTEKQLRTILENAGPYFRTHDPSSWPRQAKLAANEQWNELKLLQSQLNNRSKLPKELEPAPATIVALSHVNGGTFQPGQPFRIERLIEPPEVAEEEAARHEELEAEFAKAKKAIRKFIKERQIIKAVKAGQITGVSARFRTKFGHVVSPLQVVIGVNVSKKLCPLGLARCGLKPISPIYDGIRVKVVEGTFEQITSKAFFARGNLTPKAPLPFTEEIAGGVPIAPPNDLDDFGTLALVTDITENAKSVYIGLTCDHVVGNQSNVHQLGPQNTDRDIGDVRATITPPNRNQKFNGVWESVDCASIVHTQNGNAQILLPPSGVWARGISHPVNQSPSNSTTTPIVFSTRRVESVDKRLPLWKFGTGIGMLLEGRIAVVNNDQFIVNGNKYENNFTVQLNNSNAAFATGGDSGSVLALEARAIIDGIATDVFVAVGILFAVLDNKTVGLACNMSHVIRALSLENKIPANRKVDDWSRR